MISKRFLSFPILRQKSFFTTMATAKQIKPAERVSHFSRDGNASPTLNVPFSNSFK